MSIDISRPQIGRIYDYVLGGTFNHEADRRAAQAMLDLMPAYPLWARLNRGFLGHVGRRWAAEGRARVLDLGSGLPTQGHFNQHLPEAKILFADIDPLSVAQGQQLLGYTPEMGYVQADIREIDALLEQASAFFDDERVLAVGCIGVIYFLSDDHLRRLMERLHAYCAPGSVLALSWPCVPDNDEVRAAIAANIAHARIDFYSRTPEQVAELIAPWSSLGAELLVDVFGDAPLPVARPEHPFHHTRMFGAFAERR